MLSTDYQKNAIDKRERYVRFDGRTLAQLRDELALESERTAKYLQVGGAESAYLAVKVEDLKAEIARRERAGIRVPRGGAGGYDRLLTFAQALKDELPLERFIEAYLSIPLRRVGREHAGRCPLGHPSDSGLCFRVNTAKQLWHCWSCGNGGDLFVLVGLLNGEDRFFDQVGIVADMLGLTEGAA